MKMLLLIEYPLRSNIEPQMIDIPENCTWEMNDFIIVCQKTSYRI